jgi:N-acetylmuramoyl-L-alanine amidase
MSEGPSRMRRRTPFRFATRAGVCLAVVCALAAAAPSSGAPRPGARELFLAAQAREKPILQALAASPPEPAPTRDAMRQVVAAYRQVVLRFPTSGYCDDALWFGAQLAAETFSRHGDEQDGRTAAALLTALAREYPASQFARRVPAELSRIGAMASPSAPVAAAARQPPRTADADAGPAPSPGPVLVRDVRRRTTPEGAVVEIELDGRIDYEEGRLGRPARLVFDLANTRTMEALRDAIMAFDSGPVRQLRIGRHPNNTTRVVIETAEGVRCASRLVAGPYRLIISCGAEAAASSPSPPPKPAPADAQDVPPARDPPDSAGSPATAAAPRRAPAQADQVSQPASLPAPSPPASGPSSPAAPGAPAAAAAPAAPAANGRGGYSMARQLGLRVGRIVIDAGHGGRDPGASGPGYFESALTLDIALRLEKLLVKEPGVEVVLTRRTDEYVPLQERTAIANREGADLFVSIHANASRNRSARGVESYLLNFASTEEAAAVAARENASSTLTMSHLNDLVKQIALNSKLDESRDLAGQVQNALVRRLRPSNQALKDLGVKQAPFVVLVGAAMPSVLVEVSFMTHRQEGRLLGTGPYRQRIAEALLDGVRRYLRTLKRAEAEAGSEFLPEDIRPARPLQ